MKFEEKLVHGRLIKRYKRFLADVELDNGAVVTAHCTNSGSMKTALQEGAEVYLSPVNDPRRKTKYTWEMIRINDHWVGINTNNPNILAYEMISRGEIKGLDQYTNVKREVKYADSRFDIFAENDTEKCFVEVKNVTMKQGDFGVFPDAVTSRGKKHLETLIRVKEEGIRAVMLYVIQRMDVSKFKAACDIDKAYSETLEFAAGKGVEIIPVQVKVTPEEISKYRVLEYIPVSQ